MKLKTVLVGWIIILSGNFNLAYPIFRFQMIRDVQGQFYRNTPLECDAQKMVENINVIISKFEPLEVIYSKAAGK